MGEIGWIGRREVVRLLGIGGAGLGRPARRGAGCQAVQGGGERDGAGMDGEFGGKHPAQLAGSSRESASRFLAVLERAGVISQGRGKLTVHDPGALSNYVY